MSRRELSARKGDSFEGQVSIASGLLYIERVGRVGPKA